MKRPLFAAVAVAIGISIAGAAVPANAETFAPAGQLRDIASEAPIYGAPRPDTAQIGAAHTGDSVEAYCAFWNAGREWVKINRSGEFGFVASEAIRGGSRELPSTCPTEIESVQVSLYGKQLAGTEAFVTTGALECPAPFPYLVDDGKGSIVKPPSFVSSASEWVGVIYGVFTQVNGLVSGTTGALVTNFGTSPETLTITATCTKNPGLAKQA
jgi:hypothetical protein